MAKLVNIGCGATYHPDWINLDVAPSDPSVSQVDISKGLPFSAGSVAVCYSSHLLEHLDNQAASALLAECMRVLDRQGVIRIVVPDLEGIVREYLRILDDLLAGDKTKRDDYDWIMLELYDQVARNTSGGAMAAYLSKGNLPNEKYVVERCGMEAKKIMQQTQIDKTLDKSDAKAVSITEKIKKIYFRIRELFLRVLLGDEYRALQIGRFRLGGEIHQWMYDQYSITRLLLQSGFVDVKKCTAFESRIPEFEKYSLDALNGEIRKPDSLFIEAIKP